jgi:hypothetical protein
MTGYLPHDANLARLDDLRTRADERRPAGQNAPPHARPASSTREPIRVPTSVGIAIRRATEEDRAVLRRLAALDSAPAPCGEVLVAELGGEPQAAIEIASGATIADPFRANAHLVELLGVRAAQLREANASPRRRAHALAATGFRSSQERSTA